MSTVLSGCPSKLPTGNQRPDPQHPQQSQSASCQAACSAPFLNIRSFCLATMSARACTSVPLLSQRPYQHVHSRDGRFRSCPPFKRLYSRSLRQLAASPSGNPCQPRAESSVTAHDTAHAQAELQRRATAANVLKAMSAAQGQQFRGNGLVSAPLQSSFSCLPLLRLSSWDRARPPGETRYVGRPVYLCVGTV